MDRSLNRGLNRQDLLVTIVALAVISGAALALVLDFRPSAGAAGPAIGDLTRDRGLVERRGSARGLWYTADALSRLPEGEWLRTGSDGSARIRLERGGAIELEPFSMIVLYLREEETLVELHEGRLRAESTHTLSLRRPGEEPVRVRGRTFEAGLEGGQLELRSRGEPITVERGGEQSRVEAGSRAIVGPTGFLRPLATQLLRPAPGATVDMSQLDRLDFAWRAVPEAEGYHFVLKRGSRILLRRTLRSESYSLKDLSLLNTGMFEWSVTPIAPTGTDGAGPKRTPRSTEGTFRIVLSSAPGSPKLQVPGGTRQ